MACIPHPARGLRHRGAVEAIACGLPVVTTSAPDNLARSWSPARRRASSAHLRPTPSPRQCAQLLVQHSDQLAEIPVIQDEWLADHQLGCRRRHFTVR